LAGKFFQYQQLGYRAEGSLDGNDASYDIEFEGTGREHLTNAQVDTGARLFEALVETRGVPNRIASDAYVGSSSHGLSWHRLGVDGNFPSLPDQRAGRLQRGGGAQMHYSTSFGKVCPGDKVIVDDIAQIYAIANGSPIKVDLPIPIKPTAPKPPKVTTKNREGRPMLRVDGRLGPNTIGEWQVQADTEPDRYISGAQTSGGRFWNDEYSALIASAQRKFHSGTVDGKISSPRSDLVGAMQRHYGSYAIDKYISWPVSSLVAALQGDLNACTY
jgi:hypothetical protein